MMTGAKSKVAAVIVLVGVGVAVPIINDHQTIVNLRKENQALRKQALEIAQFREQSRHLSNLGAVTNSMANDQLLELLKLRSEVGRLRQMESEFQKPQTNQVKLHQGSARATEDAQYSKAPENGVVPSYLAKESWAFVGYADPQSALQSTLWAASNADLEKYLSGVSTAEKARITNLWQGKSKDDISAQTSNELQRVRGIRIVERQVLSEDQVLLRIYVEGLETEYKAKLNKDGDGWKFSGWSKD